MIRNLLYIILSLTIILSACKSNKVTRKPLEGKKTVFLLNQLKENEVNFKTFSAKSSITIESEKMNNSFKSTIRILKDSAIWVSVTPLFGIELARVLLTKDSLKVIDRINAEYFMGDYDYFYKKYKVALDFETIQAMLIGNRIPFEEDEKLDFSIDNERYYLGNTKKRKVVRAEKKPKKIENEEVISFWLNPTTYKIEEMLISDLTNSRFVRAQFKNHLEIENHLFPTVLNFELTEKDKNKVEIEYSRIILDKPISFSFNIPTKYEQVFY